MRWNRMALGSLAAFAMATTGTTHGLDYSFDSAGDLAADFNLASTNVNWSENSPGGVSNTRYVQTSGDNGYITEKASFALDTSSDQQFTLSTFFLVGSASGSNARRGLSIGVSNSDTVNYEGGGFLEDTALYGSVFGNGNGSSASTTNYRYAADTSNPDAVDGLSVSSNDDLSWNTWYFVEAVFDYDSTNDLFDITLNIHNENAGAVGSLIRSINIGTDIANPFGANPTLYAFLGGRDSADAGVNIAGVDGFSTPTVPEPASMALMGLGGLMILSRRRSAA